MKSTIVTLAIFASILLTLFTHSQTSTEEFDPLGEINDLPKMIRVQAEFIEMPHETYTGLMSKPRTSGNDSDLRAECAKLVKAGDAGILETMCVTALPGQSATTESISEFIYPTEYEPGELPNEINGEAVNGDHPIGSPPTPSAFDTKNTGSTFEVEAQIDANESIVELRFTPTLVYLTDIVNWGAEKAVGAAGPVEMPTFYVLSVKTGTTLIAGQPSMVAALSPKDEKGNTDPSRKVMVFIRADILTVGK
ncbi:MAG: hypothetical protein P1U90_01015 [Akkermansiaceae bacterium]|nr:hypothetical protein [Akkermansiaceae bacterium]